MAGEMVKTVSVPLPANLVAWLEQEARRLDRPLAFIVRKLILRETLNRSVDVTESIDDVVCSPAE